MTALKPIENRRVRGVPAERYPLNEKCAHPECNEATADPHHIFPRSEIGGDSWFVEITPLGGEEAHEDIVDYMLRVEPGQAVIIPHVTGLCRAHHDDVEDHRAWIKLEKGVFVWYDRDDSVEDPHEADALPPDGKFSRLSALNPQPGSREGKPKRRKKTGDARRQRKVIGVRVPQDAEEDGAGLWDEAIEALESRLRPEDDEDDRRPPYYTIMDALGMADPEDYSAVRLAEVAAWLRDKAERDVTQVRISSVLEKL